MVGSGVEGSSLAALRAQLQSLETERAAWAQQRALQAERCAWIERRQQQTVEANGTPARVPRPSKREEMQELREKALQLIKTQQQVASKITNQLRTMAQDPRREPGRSSVSSATVSRSPSPPQEKPPSATRRSNKLVLVPTTTTALGKRQLVPGANTTPTVQYPTFARTKDVPSDTTEELAAVAFRVATRHYLQTGEMISRAGLRASVDAYVGHSLREDETCAIVEAPGTAMPLLVSGVEAQTADQPSSIASKSVVLSAINVHAWIDADKSAVAELVSTWSAVSPNEPRTTQLIGTLFAHKFTNDISENGSSSMANGEALLSGLLGVGRSEDSTAVVETAFPHMTSLFKEAQDWLEGAFLAKDTQPTVVAGGTSSTPLRFDRPFNLERESVLKQVHKSRKRQRADPMKVMCMYELSGACNDANCAFQHQRDYEAVEDSDDSTMATRPSSARDTAKRNNGKREVALPTPSKALMNQFVQLRESVRGRWPSLTEILDSRQVARPPLVERTAEDSNDAAAANGSSDDGHHQAGGSASMDWNEDFVELGSPLSSPDDDDPSATAPSRFCQDDHAPEAGGTSHYSVAYLEEHLRQNPEDADAWLLLALRWLELEVSWNDENVVRVSESERLLGELEQLHVLLHAKGPSALVALNEDKVAHALHILSRALEIEANAYCEELWLLHLRLSQLIQENRDLDGELQMTEQALSFVRTSVSLWRHFLTLQASCLDKLDDGVATYCALLEAIAAASKQAKRRQVKDAFSVLLCDVVIQLCSIYCDAGQPEDASSFLWSLLDSESRTSAQNEDDEMNGDDGESEWRQQVHDQMIGDDVLILYVLHVHVSLFAAVPLWLRERSFGVSEAVNVYRLLLSSEAIRESNRDTTEALRICKAAFQTYRDSNLVPPGIEVLRHNWIVVAASDDRTPLADRLEQLTRFAEEELQRKTLLPRVITLLATLFRCSFHKPDMAEKLKEELMDRYKTVSSILPVTQVYQRFGEALHHYLVHRRDLFTIDPFRTEFPTLKFMLTRLSAILPEKNPVYSKRAIKAITGEANWAAQRASLVQLFHELVRDTLDHVVKCQLGEGDHDDSDEQDITQDTYYLVAQVQLLSQVCGPQAAIDVLDLVVIHGGSSQWSVLPRECRRIVWSVRAMLQLDHLKQDGELNPSRELFELLDRYLADVGPCSDMTAVVKQQLASRVGQENEIPSLRSAVAFCVEYADTKSSSALDLALFRLCLSSTPLHERPSQFVAYQHRLGMSSSFWLSYARTALLDSDWRRVRSGLRRLVLEDARVLEGAALRLLVSLELQDKNVQAAALALGHRLRTNPLDNTAWSLVGTLEVLFGGDDRARIDDIASKLAETGGVRLYMRPILGEGASPTKVPTTVSKLSHVKFSGLRLEHLPSAMAMQMSESLRVLDLSNNALVTLSPAICRLTKLRVLKLSGNSLVSLPESVGQLTELQVVELAHNNLSAIPNVFWDRLVQLQEIDLRWNALIGVSPRVVLLKQLNVLRVAGNKIVWKDLEPISAKLPAACTVDIAPVGDRRSAFNKAAAVVALPSTVGKEEGKLPPAQIATTIVKVVKPDDDVEMSIAQETTSFGEAKQAGTTISPEEHASNTTTEDQGEEAMAANDGEVEPTCTDNAIEIDDEDESKTDASPRRENGESDDVSVIDVEMTDTSESANPSAPASPPLSQPPSRTSASPARDDRQDDDDDEVECLGSSIAVTVAHGSPSRTTMTADQPRRSDHATEPPLSEDQRRLLAAVIARNTGFQRCSVCAAPNSSDTHQRLNGNTLCVACLVAAVNVLRDEGTVASKKGTR